LGPKGAETGTLRDHATTLRRGQALRPQGTFATMATPLERCSATFALDIIPFLPLSVFIPRPRLPGLASSLGAPSLRHSPSPPPPFTFLPSPCYSGPSISRRGTPSLMTKLNSARNFFERARNRGSKSNKDTVNGEEVKKELQDVTKRGYRRALELWHQWVD
jgi:hypothetical protein